MNRVLYYRILCFALLAFNALDAIGTAILYHLTGAGPEGEKNPLMRILLEYDWRLLVFLKVCILPLPILYVLYLLKKYASEITTQRQHRYITIMLSLPASLYATLMLSHTIQFILYFYYSWTG